jgi:hypothetical protein
MSVEISLYRSGGVEGGDMELRPGMRLRSERFGTEVVVVRAPSEDVALTCGGDAMVEGSGAAVEHTGEHETLLGKRYSHDDLGVELLCSRGGAGVLEVNGEPLGLKDAKALPSSD